jgi:hypothetical protein
MRRCYTVTVGVADDEAGVRFVDGPGRREAAGHQRQSPQISRPLVAPNSHAPARADCDLNSMAAGLQTVVYHVCDDHQTELIPTPGFALARDNQLRGVQSLVLPHR